VDVFPFDTKHRAVESLVFLKATEYLKAETLRIHGHTLSEVGDGTGDS
jgi:hypothetical protein